MTVPNDLWGTPGTAGRPETPYGGFYPQFPGGFQPYAAPPKATAAIDVKAEGMTGLVIALACVFLGAPLGFLWAAFRPHFNVLLINAAEESALKPQFTADMTLAGIGLAAGAIVGVLAGLFASRRGTGTVIGLALGGYGAMRVAARVGKLAAHPEHLRAVVESQLPPGETLAGSPAQVNEFLDLFSFHLRSGGVLYSFSIGAVVLFAVMTLIRDRTAPKPYRLEFGAAPARG